MLCRHGIYISILGKGFAAKIKKKIYTSFPIISIGLMDIKCNEIWWLDYGGGAARSKTWWQPTQVIKTHCVLFPSVEN